MGWRRFQPWDWNSIPSDDSKFWDFIVMLKTSVDYSRTPLFIELENGSTRNLDGAVRFKVPVSPPSILCRHEPGALFAASYCCFHIGRVSNPDFLLHYLLILCVEVQDTRILPLVFIFPCMAINNLSANQLYSSLYFRDISNVILLPVMKFIQLLFIVPIPEALSRAICRNEGTTEELT
ncbi:hypothetical protein ACH5RR_041763 [Cinchona calisaya]|uniref:Uncharacterized protein n=1 Tax=Cinchona calisaya TaxID=153742 RepID=A0ABD2XX13_9GENT